MSFPSIADNNSTRCWINLLDGDPQTTKFRLFCFPYAGGSAYSYQSWAAMLPPGIEVYALQLPGRGTRISEPLITDFRLLIDVLLPSIRPYLDVPFVFFGHSMGAVIAGEIAREIQRVYNLRPAHLFISASSPLSRVGNVHGSLSMLSDDALAARLNEMNGMPSEMLENHDFMELVLPIIRADFQLLANYSYKVAAPVECPITVFGGDRDPAVRVDELAGWSEISSTDVQVHVLHGDHFFLYQPDSKMFSIISTRLGIQLHRDGRPWCREKLPNNTS